MGRCLPFGREIADRYGALVSIKDLRCVHPASTSRCCHQVSGSLAWIFLEVISTCTPAPAKPDDVIRLMEEEFGARIASRSWGDRLACKWNFIVPGLPELVEIHIGRLGQTGEQFAIAHSLIERTRYITVGKLQFRVPSISDRLMISTLQRMYRHFYFRLCDIIDSSLLVVSGSVDYEDLHAAAMKAGIWEGVATYLAIVSDYICRYRGVALDKFLIVGDDIGPL